MPFQFEQRVGEARREHGRDALRGLVEQQCQGISHQRAGDGQHLLLAAGKAGAGTIAGGGQAGKEGVEPLRRPGRQARSCRLAADFEIFRHRKLAENAAIFRHVTQPESRDFVGRKQRRRRSIEKNVSRNRRNQPHDRFQRSGFSGAIAAKQNDHFARSQLERSVEQDARAPVAGVEAPYLKQGQGRPPARAGWRVPASACRWRSARRRATRGRGRRDRTRLPCRAR